MKNLYGLFLTLLFLPGITGLSHAAVGDDCVTPNVIAALPFNQSGLTTCGALDDFDNTDPGSCNNTYVNGEDYVFTYTPPSTVCVDITLTSNGTTVGLFLHDGCPTNPATNCITRFTTGGGNPSPIQNVTLIGGQTYYIIVGSSTTNPCIGSFTMDVQQSVTSVGQACCNPQVIGGLPFNQVGMTTCGFGDENSNGDGCNSNYLNGDDYIFEYTSPGNECITITLSNETAGADVGVFLMDGCPDDAATSCVGSATQIDGSPTLGGVTLSAGTYYITVSTFPAPQCTGFDIDITTSPAGGAGSTCGNPNSITSASLPFNQAGLTTCCFGNEYDNLDACASAYMTGDDYVFEYVNSAGEQCLDIALTTTDDYFGIFLLDACPDDPSATCLGSGTTTGLSPSLSAPVPGNGTYYIVVSSNSTQTTCGDFDIDITATAQSGGGYHCAAPYVIPSLPFSLAGRTTACYGDIYSSGQGCVNNSLSGDEFVFEYTCTVTECISVSLTNTLSCAGLFLMDGCPDATPACIENVSGTDPSFGGRTITPGVYYIIVSSNPFCGQQTTTFDIDITTSPAGLPGSTCANPMVIPSFPYNQTGLTTCCYGDEYDNLDACGSSYMNGEDYVFEYTAVGPECITITLSNETAGADVGVFLLDGCPDAGATCLGSATQSNGSPTLGSVVIPGAGTYYIVVSTFPTPNCTSFDIDIVSTPAGAAGSTCGNATVIPGLPYSNTGLTTCCYGDDYSSADACGSTYMNGDDYVFTYTSVAAECLTITVSNVSLGADVGVFLLDGCPNAGATCLGSATQFNGGPTLGGIVTPGPGTYYIVVSSTTTPQCTNFDIGITSTPAGGPGSTCGNPTNIAALPYSASGLTTCCFGDDYSSADACGSTYMNGDDYVFTYTPASDECISVTLSNTGSWTGVFVLDDCPNSGTANCIANNTNSGGNPAIVSPTPAVLTGGTTYYIVVSTTTSNPCTNFDINVATTACPPPGQICGTALTIPSLPYISTGLTTNGFGDDYSSASLGSCGSSYENGDDFLFEYTTATAQLITITLTNTSTFVGVFVYDGCPDNASTSCIPESGGSGCGSGGSTNTSSSGNPFGTFNLSLPGTYYFMVFTFPAPQWTNFDIEIVEIASSNSPISQDCDASMSVCDDTVSVSNPGFSGTGIVCDFSGSGNCTGGERASAWYTIDIAAAGVLNFNIIPNDATVSSCGAETDYDFVLWKIAGAGATDCATIQSTGGDNEVACNYSFYGVTGCSAAGTAPAPFNSCFDPAFSISPAVVAGEQYILVVQNFTQNTNGFILDFSTTAPGVINYGLTSTTLTWSGQLDSDVDQIFNWGGCGTPDCTIDAEIVSAATNMPVVTGIDTVRDLTVNAGATLTLDPGAVLRVCGDIINNGTITADPTSTIEFIGTGTQNVLGNLTGANKFGNVIVNKTPGTIVELLSDLDVDGDFTITSGRFDGNTRNLSITGNYTDNVVNGFIAGLSTVTLNGTGTQVISSITGMETFYNLTIAGTGTKTPACDLTMLNDLTISSTLDMTALNYDISLAGNWSNTGTFIERKGRVTMINNNVQDIANSGGSETFYEFYVSKSGGQVSGSNDLFVNQELQMVSGTFLIDGETVTCNNLVNITGGTLRITSGAIFFDEDSDADWQHSGGTVDIDSGTVTIGDYSSDHSDADYNISAGGALDISGGTLYITDCFDMDGGSLNISGTGVLDVKAATGTGSGDPGPKFDLQGGGTFSMSGGTVYLRGAYKNASMYPAMDLNCATVNVTGGTIECTITGSNDESYFIDTRGNAIYNLRINH